MSAIIIVFLCLFARLFFYFYQRGRKAVINLEIPQKLNILFEETGVSARLPFKNGGGASNSLNITLSSQYLWITCHPIFAGFIKHVQQTNPDFFPLQMKKLSVDEVEVQQIAKRKVLLIHQQERITLLLSKSQLFVEKIQMLQAAK